MKLFINNRRAVLFRNIIRIMGIVMASFLWLFGLGNLINPTVPESYLDQNTRICVMMMITGVITVYSLFRPFSGGLLLCACAAGMGLIFKGFFHNPITPMVMITGIIFFVSGYFNRRQILKDFHKPL